MPLDKAYIYCGYRYIKLLVSPGMILSHIKLSLLFQSDSFIPLAPLTIDMEETVEDAAFGQIPKEVLTESMIDALKGGVKL